MQSISYWLTMARQAAGNGIESDLCAEPSGGRVFAGAQAAEVEEALCKRVLGCDLSNPPGDVHIHLLKAKVPCLLVLGNKVNDDVGTLDCVPNVVIIPHIKILP